MTMQGFIDDSGSHAQSAVYVVGGFLGEANTWSNFTDEWKTALHNEPRINYLHTTDAYNLRREFGGWHPRVMQQKLLQLAEVIKKFPLTRIDASISRQDYDDLIFQQYPGPVGEGPYFLLYYKIVTAIARVPELANIDVQLMFDEQGRIGESAQAAWSFLKDEFPNVYAKKSRPTFGSDLTILPLQAADMYAWHARRYMIEKAEGKNPVNYLHIHRVFVDMPHLSLPIYRDDLIELVSGIVIREANIKNTQA
jgi:hypothetical protein